MRVIFSARLKYVEHILLHGYSPQTQTCTTLSIYVLHLTKCHGRMMPRLRSSCCISFIDLQAHVFSDILYFGT